MKAKDIKEGHIYYVNFNPTRTGEFDSNHLALVLKKNINKITFIVIPLTSDDKGSGKNGEQVNKIDLGVISTLPKRLQGNASYAVYDQIRTVHSSRFSEVWNDDGKPMDVSISREKLMEIITKIVFNITENLDASEKAKIFQKKD